MGDYMQQVRDLEGQIDELLSMYDLAEKAYPYSITRGDKRPLNEN